MLFDIVKRPHGRRAPHLRKENRTTMNKFPDTLAMPLQTCDNLSSSGFLVRGLDNQLKNNEFSA